MSEKNPVFVTGLMKSGTTLLMSLLDGHKDVVFMPDEPSFPKFLKTDYKDSNQIINDILYGKSPLNLGPALRDLGLCPEYDVKRGVFPEGPLVPEKHHRMAVKNYHNRGLSNIPNFDPETYFNALRKHFTEHPPQTAMDAILTCVRLFGSGKMWGFKQPVSSFRSDSLSWFYDSFPYGKPIVIVRDPRAQFNSLKKMYRRRGNANFLGYPEAMSLKKSYKNILFSIKGRAKFVFYEDLVTQPEQVMREIASYIGVDFSPTLLTPSRFGVPMAVSGGRERFGANISSYAVNAWQSELSHKEIVMIESATKSFISSPLTPYECVTNKRILVPPPADAARFFFKKITQ